MMKAVIFDLWYTLAYLEGLEQQEQHLETILGEHYGAYRDEFVAWHEDKRTKDEFFHDVQKKLGLSDAVVDKVKAEHGLPQFLYEDVKPALERLKEKGYKLAIVSNSPPTTKERFARFELDSYFDALIWSFDYGVRKPNAKIFHAALERLGVQAEEAIFIGDSKDKDVEGAQAVGMQAFLLDRRNKYPKEKSLSSLNDLFEYLG